MRDKKKNTNNNLNGKGLDLTVFGSFWVVTSVHISKPCVADSLTSAEEYRNASYDNISFWADFPTKMWGLTMAALTLFDLPQSDTR